MRDHDSLRAGPGDCPDAVRDQLPTLLHGRLAPAERARVEAHVAGCAECTAELAFLGDARASLVAAAPTVDVAAIAAAVRAATVAPARPVARPPHRPAAATSVDRRPSRWRGPRVLQALAATLVLAVGSGALLRSRAPVAEAERAAVATAPTPVAAAPGAPGAPAAIESPAARGSIARGSAAPVPALIAAAEPALGAGLDDLSDAELQGVVDAVAAPDGALPIAEPEAPLAPVEGGDAR